MITVLTLPSIDVFGLSGGNLPNRRLPFDGRAGMNEACGASRNQVAQSAGAMRLTE